MRFSRFQTERSQMKTTNDSVLFSGVVHEGLKGCPPTPLLPPAARHQPPPPSRIHPHISTSPHAFTPTLLLATPPRFSLLARFCPAPSHVPPALFWSRLLTVCCCPGYCTDCSGCPRFKSFLESPNHASPGISGQRFGWNKLPN